jgi:integrase
LKPTGKQYAVFDGGLKNFGVRVGARGTLTFFVSYRAKGKKRRETIGHYPLMTLADARDRARKALYEARYTSRTLLPNTPYKDATERYLKGARLRPSTRYFYTRYLNHFEFQKLSDIEPREVTAQLHSLTKPAQTAAFNSLNIFLNWAVRTNLIEVNPIARLPKPKPSTPRERVLSDRELYLIWQACSLDAATRENAGIASSSEAVSRYLPRAFAAIVKLLILTGQRRNEIASLHSSWITTSTFPASVAGSSSSSTSSSASSSPNFSSNPCITFPKTITKNKTEHTIPLSTLSTALIATRPSGLLFPAKGQPQNHFSGWSKSKKLLDQLSGVTDWTLHDLRRTWSTKAAEWNVCSEVVTEKILNHLTGGSLSPIARVYNRHRYLSEAREAVNRFEAAFIQNVLERQHTTQ